MECPYCGAELNCEDSYGTKEFIIYGNENYKNGDIYRCLNHNGFETEEDVMNYLEMDKQELDDFLKDADFESWEDVACESSCHSVSGSFYTDRQDNLYEGYPC